jgi:ribosomal protein S18 acetylase RimI-like enzyme
MEKRNMNIRMMTDNEVTAVSGIVCAGYNWLARLEGFTPDQTARLIAERGSPEEIIVQRRISCFMVEEIDGFIAGVVSIHGNEISKLYVDPKLGGQGIGKALFEAAEKHIISEGFNEIRLGAFPSAAGFYIAMGMEKEGSRINTGGPMKGRTMLFFRKRLGTKDSNI